MWSAELGAADAAVFETFVSTRYLSLFSDLALSAIRPTENASLIHLGCRTGAPDIALAERLAGGSIVGVDPSGPAIDIARAKAHVLKQIYSEYAVCASLPTSFVGGSFSHALSLHPVVPLPPERRIFFEELSRLLMPGGQAVVALPLRGSFPELADLLREYALKYDSIDVGKAVDAAALMRPTIESLADELEGAGFEDVDVEILRATLDFSNGREFFEDPAVRLLVLPELRASLGFTDATAGLAHVREAIDRYWAESRFELTVNVGCASARRL